MTSKRRPVIGLTGGIGSGKSRVAQLLGEAGCLVANADHMANEALELPAVKNELRGRWGDGVFGEGGRVNRSAIAEIVFGNAAERKWLESVIHPRVEASRRAAFAGASPPVRALVIDAPLLLEAGLGESCDSILFVDASPEVRLARVQRDRGWSAAELARREAAQLPLDEKRSRAHHVIGNEGEIAELIPLVQRYLNSLTPDQTSTPEM